MMPRVLLIKPYQPTVSSVCQPPLGLLYLASMVRHYFGTRVEINVLDLRLDEMVPLDFAALAGTGQYDVIGISAMNFEAPATHQIAQQLNIQCPEAILALGGPYAHSSLNRIQCSHDFDWIFDGEAEHAFARALDARFFDHGALQDISGLHWRDHTGAYVTCGSAEPVQDLDSIPMPAWDLVDFERYAEKPNQMGWKRGRLYAPLFTSRGCPYKCNYCHDLFGKTFRWRSAENVLAEIRLLQQQYNIDEFQIIDDIYNLHKPRMRSIAHLVIDEFGPRTLLFCFPNGIRADIIDVNDLPLLREMGVYQMAIAVETTTLRLQQLVEKHLDLEKTREVITACDQTGILTKGFFMIGFPTESRLEIETTIRYAVSSRFTFAGFYIVIPQEGTAIYELAETHSANALNKVRQDDFYAPLSWYQLAYGINLHAIQKSAFRRFYLQPRRMWRIARSVAPGSLLSGFFVFLKIIIRQDPIVGRRALKNIIRTHAVTQPETTFSIATR